MLECMAVAHDKSQESHHELLSTAIDAAKAAGAILLRKAHDGFHIEYKDIVNLVTDADRAAEEAIISTIRDTFPSHRFLAEERGLEARTESLFQWVIDPLDGTTNFAHGFPFYAVSIGLEYAGRCVLGVVFNPVHDELFTAVLGQGAFVNGRRIRVSRIDHLNASLVVTGFAYDIRDNPNNNLDHFARVSLRVQGMRRTGSAALDLCYVASGRFDAFWEVQLQPWDMAAGSVILQEAGGLTSAFQKGSFSIYGRELVASNGLIHDELLAILNENPLR